jgi:hypothetical protein
VKSDVIPEIVRSEPHNCPICGMLVAVELRTRATETEWEIVLRLRTRGRRSKRRAVRNSDLVHAHPAFV